jgi:hypothetical protein
MCARVEYYCHAVARVSIASLGSFVFCLVLCALVLRQQDYLTRYLVHRITFLLLLQSSARSGLGQPVVVLHHCWQCAQTLVVPKDAGPVWGRSFSARIWE